MIQKSKLMLLVLLLMTTISCKAKTTITESPASYTVKNNEEVYVALPKLKPGDNLVFEDGDYQNLHLVVNGSGLAEKFITVTAKNPGKVFISGNSKVELRGEYIVFKGYQRADIRKTNGINIKNLEEMINQGIKGRPLTWDDVRPNWLKEIPNNYWRDGN